MRKICAQLAMLALTAASAFAQTEPGVAAAPDGSPPFKTRADSNECARPAYPQQSLRDGQQGTVTLSFLIGVDGTVQAAKIVKSSGFMLLDKAAKDGIVRCRFKPSYVNGKPEQSWMQMQYVWRLSEPGPAEAAATVAKFRADAERGNAEAQYRLGKALFEPATAADNQTDALFWLRKAAEQGHLHAQYTMGMIMQAGLAGPGDAGQAMGWYRMAGGQGLPEAQHAMAMMLLIGGRPADQAAARNWMKLAVEQGYAPSQARYGFTLLEENTTESIAQGIAMVRKAAAQNDASGQYLLGRCYATGRGAERDLAEAARWYEKAAMAGNRQAQAALADMYERGQGVAADAATAAQWRALAGAPRARPR